MDLLLWIANNWLEILTATGVPGIFLAAYGVFTDARARKNANAISITQLHADLMRDLYTNPDLKRAVDENADIAQHPISLAERTWTSSLILLMGTSFTAMNEGEMVSLEGFQMDVRHFLSLPIPKAVWEQVKQYQNGKFVKFVDRCLEFQKHRIL